MNAALRIQVNADARNALAQLKQVRGQLAAIQRVSRAYNQSMKTMAREAHRLAQAQLRTAVASERLQQAQHRTIASAARSAAAQSRAVAATQGLGRAQSTVATTSATAATNLSRSAAATQRQAAAANRATTSMKTFSASLLVAGKNTQWLGRILETNITLPLLLISGLAVKWAFDFERAMTRIRKVYNGAAGDIDLLSQAFRALSDIYGVHIDQVAEIGGVYAQAGLEGAQLARLTRSTLDAMILGDLDVEQATSGILTIMGAYRLASTEVPAALAILNKVENETAVGFGDLLIVMQKTAGTARLMGVSMEELAAMAASLVPIAANSSEAGNALKTLMPRVLVPTTQKAADAFKQLGVDIESASFRNATFTERIFQLSEGWRENGQQAKAAFASYVFGNRQISRGITLLEDMFDEQGRYATAINATADAQENLNTFNRELAIFLQSEPQRFSILTNRIRNLLIEALIPMLPVINNILAAVVAMAHAFGALDPHIQQLIVGSLLALAALGPLMKIFGLGKIVLGGLAAGLGWAVTAFGALVGAISLPVAAIVALIAIVGVLVFVFRDELAQAARWAAEGIADAFTGLGPFFTSMMNGIGRIVNAGLSFLPRSFHRAFRAVINIVRDAALAVYAWLQWMNPFARHSPSLVEQVIAGNQVIAASYDHTASRVATAMARVKNTLRDLEAQIASARREAEALELQEAIEAASLAGASPDTIRSLFADLVILRREYERMTGAIRAQEAVVDSWQRKLDAANDTLDEATDQLRALEDAVSDLDQQISDSESRLADWLDAAIVGTYAFEDALFANSQAQKELRLQIALIKKMFLDAGLSIDDVRRALEEQREAAEDLADANDGVADSLLGSGLSADEARTRMGRLAAEIDRLRGEELDLRLAGAGSDVLRGIQDQIDDTDKAREDLAQILGDGGSDNPLEGLTPELIDALDLLDELEDQLEGLQLEGEILSLEESLQLDEARKIIADTQRLAEYTLEEILAGIATEMGAIEDLTARREQAVEAVERQRDVVDQLTAARDAVQASYDAERKKLEELEQAYRSLADSIDEVQEALDNATGLGDDIQDAIDEAAGGGGLDGDFELPGGPGGLEEELGSLQDLVDAWIAEAEAAFDEFNPFGTVRDKISSFRNWVRARWDDLLADIDSFKERFKGKISGAFAGLFEGVSIRESWDDLWAFLEEDIWGPIRENILPPIENGIQEIADAFGPLVLAIQEFFNEIIAIFAQLWTEVQPHVTELATEIDRIFREWAPVIAAIWEGATRQIGVAIELATTIISGFLRFLTGVIKIMTGLLTGDWRRIWEGAQLIVGSVLDTIISLVALAIQGVWNQLRLGFTVAWEQVKAIWRSLGLPTFTSITNWIERNFISKLASMANAVITIFTSIPRAIGSAFSTLARQMGSPVNTAISIINKLAGGVNGVARALGTGFRMPSIPFVPIPRMASGGMVPETEVGGGFLTNQARAIVGEGSNIHPEFVIPTDPKYRSRALALLTQLVGKIGMKSGGTVPHMALGGLLGGGSTGAIAAVGRRLWTETKRSVRGRMNRVPGPVGAFGRAALEAFISELSRKISRWITDLTSTVGSLVPTNIFAAGGQLPRIHNLAEGAFIRGGFGGVLARIGEKQHDEAVVPLNRSSGFGNTVNIYGNLEFPNITDPDDVEEFVTNLENLAET